VASSVAGVIEPTLQVAEIRRSAERPTSDLTAYDLYLRALSHAYACEKGDVITALDLLTRAIEHDPNYGPALSLAAGCKRRACQLQRHVRRKESFDVRSGFDRFDWRQRRRWRGLAGDRPRIAEEARVDGFYADLAVRLTRRWREGLWPPDH
jgi:hypothetical protein